MFLHLNLITSKVSGIQYPQCMRNGIHENSDIWGKLRQISLHLTAPHCPTCISAVLYLWMIRLKFNPSFAKKKKKKGTDHRIKARGLIK